jgi:hypothetical protein
MTRQQYRTRLERLVKCGLISTRPTRNGTVARLTSGSVFDVVFSPNKSQSSKINPPMFRGENGSEQPTANPPSTHRQPRTDTDKPKTKDSELITLGNSIPTASSNGKRQSELVVEGYQNQDQPAQDHVKWPEFAAWCRSEGAKRGKGGQPTEAGFWKWLCGQKPQWRNKRRPDFDEHGYLLDGKFLPAHEANAMALQNPELATKFVRAIKRDGKIQMIPRI